MARAPVDSCREGHLGNHVWRAQTQRCHKRAEKYTMAREKVCPVSAWGLVNVHVYAGKDPAEHPEGEQAAGPSQ